MRFITLAVFSILISCSGSPTLRLTNFYGADGINRKTLSFTTNKSPEHFIKQLNLYFQSEAIRNHNQAAWAKVQLSDLSSETMQVYINLLDRFDSEQNYTKSFIGIRITDLKGNDLLANKDLRTKAQNFFQRIVDQSFNDKTPLHKVERKVRKYKDGDVVFITDLDKRPKIIHRATLRYKKRNKAEKVLVNIIVNKEGKVRWHNYASECSDFAKERIKNVIKTYRFETGLYQGKIVEFRTSIPFNFKSF